MSGGLLEVRCRLPPVSVGGMHEPAGDERDVLLVNPSSGDGSGPSADELTAAAAEIGVHVIELGEDDDLTLVARSHAADALSLGMAGGDGSLGCVAAEAIRGDIPFVCIPFGTRNHFALDLGLDRDDPIGSLDAYRDRRERTVDFMAVGDRVVLNNLTFGVYADVVHSEGYRDAKFSESTRITRELLRGDRESDHMEIIDPEGVAHEAPFALVIANNSYGTNLGRSGFGRRATLEGGVLEVSLVDADTGWDLASLLWAAAVSDTPDHDSFTQWTVQELDLATNQATIRAGIDGEAVTLEAPVQVRIVPGGLRLLVPTGATVVERRGLLRALVDRGPNDQLSA
jgi:diacylglycerol kinase family enzyme